MKLYRSKIMASAALVVLLLAASPMGALAHQVATDDPDTSDQSVNDGSGTGSSDPNVYTTRMGRYAADGGTNSDASENNDSLRSRAQKLLSDKRQNRHEHTRAQRQKACEQHQNSIDDRFVTLGD